MRGVLKILVLTNLYPNPYQPQRATFNRQQVRALASQYNVRVIAPILWTDELQLRHSQGMRLEENRIAQCDGLTVYHPRYWYPPKVLRGLYGKCFERSVRRTFENVVRDFEPDLLYAPWTYPDGWAGVQLGKTVGLPVVIKVHGSDLLLLPRHPGRRAKTLAALRDAHAVVTVSKNLQQAVREQGIDSDKVHVVYNGVDTQVFTPGDRTAARSRLGLPNDVPIILFVGNLHSIKGIDLLLDACLRLARSRVEFQCHLVGDGGLRSALLQQAQDSGIDSRVFFHGTRPHDELVDWYRSANVLALPSRSEGVPNVLLEASACGLPCVATRVGGIPEISEWGQIELVGKENARELAAALLPFVDCPVNDYNKTKRFGRDLSQAAAELSGLFERVVSQQIEALPAVVSPALSK
jgi:glycosyltransferase involved in cell wall biosynthesis